MSRINKLSKNKRKKQSVTVKVFFLTFFCLIVLIQTHGQQNDSIVYRPLPTANAMWREDWNPANPSHQKTGSSENYQYLIIGDTIINGKTYHNLARTGYGREVQPGGSHTWSVDEYAGYFRNDTLGKKVWYISPDNENEQLLYDFNLQIGDTLPTLFDDHFFYPAVIINIDTLSLNNDLYKRFEVYREFFSNFYIIEGIGSTTGLLPKEFATLNCFSIDKENIYINPIPGPDYCALAYLTIEDYYPNTISISLYPNPTYSAFQIKGLDAFQNYSISIYNMYGQIIMQEQLINKDEVIPIENLCAGVYIVNIRVKDSVIVKCKLIKL